MFAEFVGVTQEVSGLIEARRNDPAETKNDILLRILSASHAIDAGPLPTFLDVGQGVRIADGEQLYLFLSKAGREKKPDGIAQVRDGSLYLGGERIPPSHGSVLAPAMHKIQRRIGHMSNGKPISLSAFRQWHVIRDNKFVALDQLKDPKLRRTRTTN